MIKGNLEKDDRLFFVRAALCDGTFFLISQFIVLIEIMLKIYLEFIS